ncbi:MAG: phage portal protein [Lachnospiraceae bacterium]|nr:phage portal protein [Lachnospiraceae bacterium]MBR3586331.1 phage portal protein [Oscillospiraceae bacterium]
MPKIAQRLRDLFGRTTVHVSITPEENPWVEGLSARQLYATQENLYAVVSFLSDSIAQLPLKVYTRDGEFRRRRDRESAAAKLLYKPNNDQTAYDFWDAVLTEYFLMGVSTIWVLPDTESESGYQMRLIPKEWIIDTERSTNYAPDTIKVMTNGTGTYVNIPRTEFVQFRRYSPGNPGGYQSPIAALRQTLSEQIQAGKFRTEIWSSSGRFNAYLTRPANVQPWTDEQRMAFVTAFREGWGKGGGNRGKIPLLEDGMEIKPYSFNAKESQFAETKQLSREDVAAAYHINPSLIWHTTTQTYASAKDNARALYADCLGPVLQMLQQRINSFLLPMVGADENTYVEFDLTEKLKGSFEERASIIQASVGGPWMTRNEARADNNLPPVDGGDELIIPLNVVEGGQASPQDTHMNQNAGEPEVKLIIPSHRKDSENTIRIKGKSNDEEDEEVAEVLRKFFKRQANSVLPKLGAKSAEWWDEDRWNKELADDLLPLIEKIADKHGMSTADVLGTDYGKEITRNYLRKLTEGRAKAINVSTLEKLEDALEDEETEPAEVFEKREGKDADIFGQALATAVANWATIEAVHQAQSQGYERKVEKEWVTGPNARDTHIAMNGQRVGIDDIFSNGARWPGDDNLSPAESCGCNCSTEVIITEG